MHKYNDLQLGKRYKLREFFILFILIWAASFGVAYSVIAFNVNQYANSEMHSYGSSLIRKFDKLLDRGEEALDELNQLSISECSPDAVRQIKISHFRNYLTQNSVILMPNGRDICSSIERAREDSLREVPSHLVFNHIRYWFKQEAIDSAPSEYHMVMEKGNARINMHLQLLFDSYLIDQSYLAAQFLSQSQVVASSKWLGDSSVLDAKNSWRSQFISSSERAPFSVVVARSESHIQSSVVAMFKESLGWIALLASVICLLAYLLIRQYRNSFKFALIDAMTRRAFVPYFQPIIDTKKGTCAGAEVLTRWFCRDGSQVSPAIFIPAAEQYGLMPALTRSVITLAFKNIGLFLSEHPQLYISINLSLDDLEDDGIYELLEQEKKKYKLRDKQLRLELTERQFITKRSAILVLQRYREAGYQVYIDDFGTGYSSLAYLTDLPINTLKIDKTFIENLGRKSATSSVTKHIIEMANTLNLELIAEGVETEEQCRILQALGVHMVQGWLYSKALPALEWVAFCKRHTGEGIAPTEDGR